MKKGSTLLFAIITGLNFAYAQYAPQAGVAGSTAISATSNLFAGWATGCTVQRGYMDIAQPSLGYAYLGDSSMSLGMADAQIVSLGDSGVATLSFASPIYNGPGPDFAVFENGFQNPNDLNQGFLELAFVEVSSDGTHFFRFPAMSLTQDTTQLTTTDYMDASKLNNLAGKYVVNYGTPFDLQELNGIPELDINNVNYVRIIDVVGSVGEHASRDSAGHIINDPYPTAFPSSGFDLDAVGVINQLWHSNVAVVTTKPLRIYPNPATDRVIVALDGNANMELTDVTGRVVSTYHLLKGEHTISLKDLKSGIYYLDIQDDKGGKWVEKIIKL